MPTFLATPKMHPALVARIEARVRGRGAPAPSRGPRLVAAFRLTVLVTIVGAVASLVVVLHRRDVEIERTREALLAGVRAHRAALGRDAPNAVVRVETWLGQLSERYEGDLIAPDVTGPGALARVLSAPVMYVHGSVGAFRTSRGIAEAAAISAKDAFLVCLLDAPTERTEPALLAKVRVAYAGGAPVERVASNAHRFHAARVGLPFLSPAWEEKVSAAEATEELRKLEGELSRAPIEEAKRAAMAGVLVAVMDEDGTSTGLSELDGERPHDVRLGIVDLARGQVLLRLRRHVDPSWISLHKRSRYASGLDACALAYDVGHELQGR